MHRWIGILGVIGGVGLVGGIACSSASGGAEADTGLGVNAPLNGRAVFPADNPWNEDISKKPVDPRSATILTNIGLTKPLHPDFGTLWKGLPNGIPYVVVPGTQPKIPVEFEYADESDPGPYPIPANPPIERDGDEGSDRHLLMIDRDNWKLYELFSVHKVGEKWKAGSGAIFDMKSNKLRPAGWTSADAAGLPIFPGLVRYEEAVERKTIDHALRFTVRHTRRAYLAPARHYASQNTSPDLPPMGMRVRLKADYDLSPFPASVKPILRALKKYGMILADNGGDWFISGAPDPRWKDDELATLKRITSKDLEVVKMGELNTP